MSRILNVVNMNVKIILKRLVWGLRFSQWWCGRFRCFGVWHCNTGWVVPDIVKDCSAVSVRVRHWKKWLFDCSRWAACLMMQRHMPDDAASHYIPDWIFFMSKTSNWCSCWLNIQSYAIEYTELCNWIYRVMQLNIQSYAIEYTELCNWIYKVIQLNIQSYAIEYTKLCNWIYKVMQLNIQSYAIEYTKLCNHHQLCALPFWLLFHWVLVFLSKMKLKTKF